MKLLSILLSFIIASSLAGCSVPQESPSTPDTPPALTEQQKTETPQKTDTPITATTQPNISLSDIPEYAGKPYVAVNGNVPYLTIDDTAYTSYETYSALDSLGRCGVCVASIGKDIMPTEERGNIGSVKPTGWQTAKYDFVDGKYLYNRCHLIGFQLTGENANTENLITGTRSMNTQGMLPFENMVADYVKETGNHVLYRVTPMFEGDNLVASGVLMEAISVEDEGDGILFCVFCYNVEPGVVIDYATGDNSLKAAQSPVDEPDVESQDYILNKSSKKFHYPDCHSVDRMSEKNKKEYYGTRQDLIDSGYSPCGNCDLLLSNTIFM